MNTNRLLTCALLLSIVGCQRIEEPTPTPTTDQWRRVQENLIDEAPAVEHEVGATFAEGIRLIGWDVEPDSVEVGEEATFTFYWEALEEVEDRWYIFVHLDSNTRQNLDHEAIDGLYPTVYWKPGDIIRDSITTTLSNDVTTEDVGVLIGFWRDDDRMEVSEPGQARVEEDGRLHVGSISASWTAPSYVIRRTTGAIDIDGRPGDRAWQRAARTPHWVHPNTGDDVSGVNTWAKLLWDDEFLYVLMNARDTDVWATIDTRDGDLWTEEVLELYLDARADGRDYLEMQINPLNTVFDAVFPQATGRDLESARAVDVAGLESAVWVSGSIDDREDRDRSWTAELRIPLAEIPGLALPIGAQTELALNFYRYDRDTDGEVQTAAWSSIGGGSFHNPARFGTATFEPPPPDQTGSGDGSDDDQTLRAPVRVDQPNRQGGR